MKRVSGAGPGIIVFLSTNALAYEKALAGVPSQAISELNRIIRLDPANALA